MTFFLRSEFLAYGPSTVTAIDLFHIHNACKSFTRNPDSNTINDTESLEIIGDIDEQDPTSPETGRLGWDDEIYPSQLLSPQWMEEHVSRSPNENVNDNKPWSKAQDSQNLSPIENSISILLENHHLDESCLEISETCPSHDIFNEVVHTPEGEPLISTFKDMYLKSPTDIPPFIESPISCQLSSRDTSIAPMSHVRPSAANSETENDISNDSDTESGEGRRGSNYPLRSLQPLALKMKSKVAGHSKNVLLSNTHRTRGSNATKFMNSKHCHPALETWLKEHRTHAIIVTSSETRQSTIHTLLQDSSAVDRDRRLRVLHKNRQLHGGTLILTSKATVESWAAAVRSAPALSLLVYTEPLSKRRQLGAQHIVSFDVVVTTLDVLRAKETLMTEDTEFSEDSGLDSNMMEDSSQRQLFYKQMEFFSVPWLSPRADGQGNIEKSNLHLLRWNRVILDHSVRTNIRLGSLKGDAIRTLFARSKMAVLTENEEEDEKENARGDFPESRHLLNIREVLGVSSALGIDSSLFRG
eukprot:CAMPEP_0182424864 /NCGR_PEP_ID=MMETSP1167-20130531/11131_1 /TAXON_ID=2988 /ORGANISM="Mallomonas Sp, Strain CCMP3275" /LENGTH=526 /DNA_ID=CAMNT_0024604999 /DNA_START=79 /DNA_END=1659 /DNA_ORIENTATION=+